MIRIDPDRIRHQWAGMSRLPRKVVFDRFPDETYEAFERGELNEESYVRHVRRALQLSGTDIEVTAAFNDIFVGVDPEVVEALRGVRESGALVVALTNTNRLHHRVWSRRYEDVLRVFEAVHCSHDLKARKPEPDAFKRVLDAHGLTPAEAVFVDDVRGHVDAAVSVGLDGVHFSSARALRRDLANRGWHV